LLASAAVHFLDGHRASSERPWSWRGIAEWLTSVFPRTQSSAQTKATVDKRYDQIAPDDQRFYPQFDDA
jgi:hypothetical protein